MRFIPAHKEPLQDLKYRLLYPHTNAYRQVKQDMEIRTLHPYQIAHPDIEHVDDCPDTERKAVIKASLVNVAQFWT